MGRSRGSGRPRAVHGPENHMLFPSNPTAKRNCVSNVYAAGELLEQQGNYSGTGLGEGIEGRVMFSGRGSGSIAGGVAFSGGPMALEGRSALGDSRRLQGRAACGCDVRMFPCVLLCAAGCAKMTARFGLCK